MPKAEKIRRLKAGESVKPPKAWFDKMSAEAKATHPEFSEERIGQYVGGIWSSYDTETKIKIVNEYEVDSEPDNPGNPETKRDLKYYLNMEFEDFMELEVKL